MSKNYIRVIGLSFIHSFVANSAGADIRINWVQVTGRNNVLKSNRLVRTDPTYGKADPRVSHLYRYKNRYKENAVQVTGTGASNNLIEYNYISGVNMGIKVYNEGTRNILRRNTIENSGQSSIVVNSSKGRVRGLLIEDNDLAGSWIEDGIQFTQDSDIAKAAQEKDTSNRGTIVRRNRISWAGENGIDLKGTSDIVIEDNIFYKVIGSNNGAVQALFPVKQADIDSCSSNSALGTVDAMLPVYASRDNHGKTPCWNRVSSSAISRGARTNSVNVIIRRNVLYNNTRGTTLEGANWKVFNNVFIGNNTDFTASGSTFNKISTFNAANFPGARAGQSTLNNIIGCHNHGELQGATAALNGPIVIANNMYWKSGNQDPVFSKDQVSVSFAAWQALKSGQNDKNSFVTADAKLAGVTTPKLTVQKVMNDFRLTAGSPAIDRGAFLTKADNAAASNSTSLKVKDSRFFFDGYGVTTGDVIKVGGRVTTITKIDYNTHTLTVAPAIQWNFGDNVSLDYKGAAPDIGAFEYAP